MVVEPGCQLAGTPRTAHREGDRLSEVNPPAKALLCPMVVDTLLTSATEMCQYAPAPKPATTFQILNSQLGNIKEDEEENKDEENKRNRPAVAHSARGRGVSRHDICWLRPGSRGQRDGHADQGCFAQPRIRRPRQWSQLNVTLTGPQKVEHGGAYSLLINDTDKTTKLTSTYVYEASKESLELTIKKGGIYYLRVYSDDGYNRTAPYTLNLGWTPNAANYTADTAALVGLPATMKGWLSSETDQNWYKVDLSKFTTGAAITITLTAPAKIPNGGAYTVELYEANKTTRIGSAYAYEAAKAMATATALKGGMTYVKVFADDGYNPKDQYTLVIEAGPNQ